ncbi:MAG: hypothetical protein UHD09_01440 [Bifidobacterium sp.]|nr:hypothetical protein [Bifidobacterium sp.]
MDFTADETGPVHDEYQYQRRFFCRAMPDGLDIMDDGQVPTLIVQGYFVHEDNYALRIRLKTRRIELEMTPDLDPKKILERYRDDFRVAMLTVKGPSVGGTRYEAERPLDVRIGAELLRRCDDLLIKNRTTAWIGEDGWNIDVFGGANYPLVVAEATRSTPVTNLVIPRFCVSEVTDEPRFSNDALSFRPYGGWAAAYEAELADHGPRFMEQFGTNTME